jgi:hypothetical protein
MVNKPIVVEVGALLHPASYTFIQEVNVRVDVKISNWLNGRSANLLDERLVEWLKYTQNYQNSIVHICDGLPARLIEPC